MRFDFQIQILLAQSTLRTTEALFHRRTGASPSVDAPCALERRFWTEYPSDRESIDYWKLHEIIKQVKD